jgi:hypothetical protein
MRAVKENRIPDGPIAPKQERDELRILVTNLLMVTRPLSDGSELDRVS